jgi:hypothetical protein
VLCHELWHSNTISEGFNSSQVDTMFGILVWYTSDTLSGALRNETVTQPVGL